MDLGTVAGIIAGLGLILASITFGGTISSFVDIPGVLIVFGGSISAMLVMFPLSVVKSSFSIAMNALKIKAHDPVKVIKQMVEISKKVRKEGPLSLQNFKTQDRFLNKAVMLMVDGVDQNAMRSVLLIEIAKLRERHYAGQQVFEQLGVLFPAFGMIGTLIGLVQMLKTLSDPSSIGPAMAVALLTTFYGALVANLVAIPVAKKLELRSKEETISLEIIVEGMVSIVKKENPAMIKQKLNAFLTPKSQLKG